MARKESNWEETHTISVIQFICKAFETNIFLITKGHEGMWVLNVN